jgi:hypothetical protein
MIAMFDHQNQMQQALRGDDQQKHEQTINAIMTGLAKQEQHPPDIHVQMPNGSGSSNEYAPSVPPLKIPVFSGDKLEWIDFWGKFSFSIHDNK